MYGQAKHTMLFICTSSTHQNTPAGARAHAVVLWYPLCLSYPTLPRGLATLTGPQYTQMSTDASRHITTHRYGTK